MPCVDRFGGFFVQGLLYPGHFLVEVSFAVSQLKMELILARVEYARRRLKNQGRYLTLDLQKLLKIYRTVLLHAVSVEVYRCSFFTSRMLSQRLFKHSPCLRHETSI